MVFKPIDLITIKQNAINEKYIKVEEFENDFKHLKKNRQKLCEKVLEFTQTVTKRESLRTKKRAKSGQKEC